MPSKGMPAPMAGKWGEICVGMTIKEIEAFFGEPYSAWKRMMLEYDYYPEDAIPYSSTSPDLVVDKCTIFFWHKAVEEVAIFYTRPDERRKKRVTPASESDK